MYSPLNDTYTTHTSLNTQIQRNPVLTTVDLSALKAAGSVEVRLTLFTFVFLFLVFCVFFHNKSYHSLRIKFTHSLFFPTKLQLQTKQQIFDNPALQTLSAPNLEVGGSVCIGDDINQQFLDADLSKLVTGSLFPDSSCYQDSNAPTVCGNGTDGVFSDDRCPSNACS